PEVQPHERDDANGNSPKGLNSVFTHSHLIKGIVAQFFYVGAQVGVGSFVIRFVKHTMPDTLEDMAGGGARFLTGNHGAQATSLARMIANAPEKMAALFLVAHQTGFMIGRFSGSWMMRRIPAPRLLSIFGLAALLCVIIGIVASGFVAVLAIVLVGYFNSIMFPTIFALSLKNLGALTKRGSSLLVMSIIGGALIPAAMGRISDASDIQVAFVMPLICYLYVIYFAAWGYRPNSALMAADSAAAA